MATVTASRADDLGPALRKARVAEGTTQSALAEIAGVGRQWLNSFEMGDKPSAPLDMVMRVAHALHVTVTLTEAPPAKSAYDDEQIDLDTHLAEYLR
jgi:transcriptional regulator with XRE-family HTH domain